MSNQIFISYAHKDSDIVFKYIQELSKKYAVWYDKGIEIGSRWADVIAENLQKSSMVIFFMSSSFLASQNCQKELVFATQYQIPAIIIYLENIIVPDKFKSYFTGKSSFISGDNYLQTLVTIYENVDFSNIDSSGMSSDAIPTKSIFVNMNNGLSMEYSSKATEVVERKMNINDLTLIYSVFVWEGNDDYFKYVKGVQKKLKGYNLFICVNKNLEVMGEALDGCTSVIVFLSKNAARDDQTQKIINYAVELNKKIFVVYIDNQVTDPGIKLQLCNCKSCQYSSAEQVTNSILDSGILKYHELSFFNSRYFPKRYETNGTGTQKFAIFSSIFLCISCFFGAILSRNESKLALSFSIMGLIMMVFTSIMYGNRPFIQKALNFIVFLMLGLFYCLYDNFTSSIKTYLIIFIGLFVLRGILNIKHANNINNKARRIGYFSPIFLLFKSLFSTLILNFGIYIVNGFKNMPSFFTFFTLSLNDKSNLIILFMIVYTLIVNLIILIVKKNFHKKLEEIINE